MTQKIQPGDALPPDVVELFEKHRRYLKVGKANYARADKALDELLKRCEIGVTHVVEGTKSEGPRELELVDQFADKNAVWAGSACKRFKLSERAVKAQDQTSLEK